MHTLQINQLGTDALKHQCETIFVVFLHLWRLICAQVIFGTVAQ